MRIPYITGSYVTDSHHYGREDLLDFLLHGPSRACWVVGNRRIGKTSLLRQLEALALTDQRLVPLFWDMQGCDIFPMHGRLSGRCGPRPPGAVRAAGRDGRRCWTKLIHWSYWGRCASLAKRAGRELLLLCDETEVLINAARDEPEAMQRFHRQLTGGRGAARRCSPPPGRSTGCMTCAASGTRRRSCRVRHVADARQPVARGGAGVGHPGAGPGGAAGTRFSRRSSRRSATATNDHPFLLQLLCTRLFQRGWLPASACRGGSAGGSPAERLLRA